MNYYNEHDPKIAAWLRGLISAGLIPDGHVDTRSIVEVMPGDLEGFTQCHFFAGIAGWSLALRLADWPADRPVWTGSCPCQPYSVAGKGKGAEDERHLWPQFFRLIRKCHPDTVFGEQVESAIGHGWLDGVSTDLEGEGYAVAAAVLGAHGVSAPHLRQRLYWVADSADHGLQRLAGGEESRGVASAALGGGLVLSDSHGREPGQSAAATAGHRDSAVSAGGRDCGLAESVVPGLEGHAGYGDARDESGRVGAREDGSVAASGCGAGRMGNAPGWEQRRPRKSGEVGGRNGEDRGPGAWDHSRLIQCRDGKLRRIPTEPALFPLADGIPYRVGKRGSVRPSLLHGAGNAIVPQTAAAFITAFLSI